MIETKMISIDVTRIRYCLEEFMLLRRPDFLEICEILFHYNYNIAMGYHEIGYEFEENLKSFFGNDIPTDVIRSLIRLSDQWATDFLSHKVTNNPSLTLNRQENKIFIRW